MATSFDPARRPGVDLAEPSTSQAPTVETAATQAQDEELGRLARLRGWDEAELSAIRSLLGEQPAGQAASPAAPMTVPAGGEPVVTPLSSPAVRPDRPGDISLPGAAELDEAMAAFETTDRSAGPAESSAETPPPAEASAEESESPINAEHEPDEASQPVVPQQAVDAAMTQPPDLPQPSALPPHPADAGSGTALGNRPSASPPESAPRPMPPRAGAPHLTDEDWLRGRRGPAANAYRRLRRFFPG